MIVIKNKYRKARDVADQTFNQASLHTNTISKESIELLQRLRDDIMSYQPKDEVNSDERGTLTQSEGNSIENVTKQKPVKNGSTVPKQVTDNNNNLEDSLHANGLGAHVIPPQRREVAQCTLTVRRVISIPVPVQLDIVSSASLILKALDKIFRTYVRGTALPGQLSGGNTVEFDGTTLTFRNFILHGPYISWKGFVHFLLDFAIASPPPLTTRLGRAFLVEVLNGNKSRLPGGGELIETTSGGTAGAAGEALVAPVGMLEAAVCFIGMYVGAVIFF